MIEIRNLKKIYNQTPLFDDLNLSLEDKKMIFICGKSGSGKSTLLNLIGGLEKIDGGQINFLDTKKEVLLTLNQTTNQIPLNPQVDFVFQDFNLINNLSAINNLQIANNLKEEKLTTEEMQKMFASVNLSWQRAHTKVESLSGGEKQRLSILRALSRQAEILLADEPTGNLDSKNGKNVFQILKQVSQKRTVIVVSHDLENAKKYADRIVYLEDGKIIKDEYFVNNIHDDALSMDHVLERENKAQETKKVINIWLFQLF